MEVVHETMREAISHREEDYLLKDDIDESLAFIWGAGLFDPVANELEPPG